MTILKDIIYITCESLFTVLVVLLGWVFGTIGTIVKHLRSNNKVWNPKHILITGASSGLGEELAKHYSTQQGTILQLLGRDLSRLNAVAEACQDNGATVQVHQIDVSDRPAMEALMTSIDTEKPLDLVVANAGVSAATVKAGDSESIDNWSLSMRNLDVINWQGTLNTILPLVETFRARKHGQFAIMSSIASIVNLPSSTSYNVSKVAQRFFGDGLRSYLADAGVGVSTIAPGFVTTPLTARNRFRMPGIISSDEAIRIIVEGLRRNEGLILTHKLVYWFLRSLAALPHPISFWFLNRVSPASKSARLYHR